MEPSAGVKQMAEMLYQRVYGFNPMTEREAAQREREILIFKLFQGEKMTPAHIAALLGCELEYVERVIHAALEKAAKNA